MHFSRWRYSTSLWLLLSGLPLAVFENQLFFPSAAFVRDVTGAPDIAVCVSGVTGALLLPASLMPLALPLGTRTVATALSPGSQGPTAMMGGGLG